MDENIDKNMIDKDEYPQTAEIESRCVHILADLWHAPHACDTAGCSTTGSSEAAMLGGLALKWKWRKKRQAEGKPADKPNLVCGPVQVCWHKFARYFDVELREIPLKPGAVCTTADQLAAFCDENTIGVVATLGVTFTCVYEPVKEFAAALDALQEKTGLDIPLHVDGASGGFVAPFLHPDLEWDFRIKRVASINTSGHKYGLSPLGVGWIIWREMADLPEELIFNVNYLGGNMPTFALNFSRPGGEIIAQYYNFLRLGREGYRRIHQNCADTAAFLARELEGMDAIEMLYDGQGGLPAVCYKLKDPDAAGFTMYDLSERGADARLADRVLSAASEPRGDGGAAHSGTPRRDGRHGFAVDRGHPARAGSSGEESGAPFYGALGAPSLICLVAIPDGKPLTLFLEPLPNAADGSARSSHSR